MTVAHGKIKSHVVTVKLHCNSSMPACLIPTTLQVQPWISRTSWDDFASTSCVIVSKIKHGSHHLVHSQTKDEEKGTSGQAFYSARAYWFHIKAPTPSRDNSLIGILKNMRLYWLSAILHPACRFVFTSLCQKKQRAYGSLKWPAAMVIKWSFIAILFSFSVFFGPLHDWSVEKEVDHMLGKGHRKGRRQCVLIEASISY